MGIKAKGIWTEYTESARPLHDACEAGDLLAVRQFLTPDGPAADFLFEKQIHADFEMPIVDETRGGWSLLFFAASSGDTDLIKFLVENGADVQRIDRYKQTAFAYAKGNVARTLIRNEQTKGTKRAEAAGHLADVEGILEEGVSLVEQLADVDSSMLHIEDRVSVWRRERAAQGGPSREEEEALEEELSSVYRECVGSQRLLALLKEDTEAGGALADKKKAATSPEEVLADLQQKKDFIYDRVFEGLAEARELLGATYEALSIVSMLMDGYLGKLPLGEEELIAAGDLYAAGRLAVLEGDLHDHSNPEAGLSAPQLLHVATGMYSVGGVQLLSAEEAEKYWRRYAKSSGRLGHDEFLFLFDELRSTLHSRAVCVAVDVSFKEHGERELELARRALARGMFEEAQKRCDRAIDCFERAGSKMQPGWCDHRIEDVEVVLDEVDVHREAARKRELYTESLRLANEQLTEAEHVLPSVFLRQQAFDLLDSARDSADEARRSLEECGPPPMEDPALVRLRWARFWGESTPLINKRRRLPVPRGARGGGGEEFAAPEILTIEEGDDGESEEEGWEEEGANADGGGVPEGGGEAPEAAGGRPETAEFSDMGRGDTRGGGAATADFSDLGQDAVGGADAQRHETASFSDIGGWGGGGGAPATSEFSDIGREGTTAGRGGGGTGKSQELGAPEEGVGLKWFEGKEVGGIVELLRHCGLAFKEEELPNVVPEKRARELLSSGTSMPVESFVQLFEDLHGKLWHHRAGLDLDDVLDRIYDMDQRVATSREGEEKYLSALESFEKKEYAKSYEDAETAAELFRESQTKHFSMLNAEVVARSKDAELQAYRARAYKGILDARMHADHDDYEEARVCLKDAAEAYQQAGLADTEEGRRVKAVMDTINAEDEQRTVEISLPACEKHMKPGDLLLLETKLVRAMENYELGLGICGEAIKHFPANARLNRIASALHLRRCVAMCSRAVSAGSESSGPFYAQALEEANLVVQHCPDWSQGYLFQAVCLLGLRVDASEALQRGIACSQEGGPSWCKLSVLSKISAAAQALPSTVSTASVAAAAPAE